MSGDFKMFILLLIFFIVYVVSVVYFYYKLKLQDDELDELYEQIYCYIDRDFKLGGKHDA